MSTAALSLATSRSSSAGMTLGALAFALMTGVDTIFKLLATHHPAYQIIFVNACFALVPVLFWAKLTGGPVRIATRNPLQHFARAGASLMSSYAAIYAYSRLPLTDFYAIVFAGPLLVTALSSLTLAEKVDRSRWVAILAGFAGILIVIDPLGYLAQSGTKDALDPHQMAVGRFAAFGSVACYACSVLMIRHMRRGEQSLAFTFYGYLTSFLVSGALLLILGGAPFEVTELLLLAVSGTVAGIATICLITAYHRSPVSAVAPFQYTQIIWGALAGYFIWNHTPDHRLLVGATVVAFCGFYVIYQEMRGAEPLP